MRKKELTKIKGYLKSIVWQWNKIAFLSKKKDRQKYCMVLTAKKRIKIY